MDKMLRRSFVLVTLFVICILTGGVEAAILEVAPSGYPYTSIQAAISAAGTGDTVLVHDGTYVENINFLGKAITVKSANGASNTLIDGNGGGSVVTFKNSEASDSVLDGFTITNGYASSGGGISCGSSSPTITNCTISGNTATNNGGGISCDSSSPTIANCTVSGNTATNNGGGISCYTSCFPTIINCTISGNTTTWGGGISCGYSSSPAISNCTISGNTASGYGGGISCDTSCFPTITNSIISGNTGNYGGGIFCYASSSPTITNCTISGNTGLSGNGGGIYIYDSTSSSTLKNSILWGDVPNEIYLDGSSITATYSDIDQDGYAGSSGNIRGAPLFVDPTNGDFRLQPTSPCIDAATSEGAPPKDMKGNPRFDLPSIPNTGGGTYPYYDMGALELTIGIIINDSFNYADDTSLTAVWSRVSGTSSSIFLAPDPSNPANQTVEQTIAAGRLRQVISGGIVPATRETVIFSFDLFDTTGGTASGRAWGELRNSASANGLLAAGINNAVNIGIYDQTRYQARAIDAGGWIQLAALRSVGWHNFRFEITGNRVDLYVDNVLEPNFTGLAAGSATYDWVHVGSALTGNTPAYFDNVYVAIVPGPPRQPIVDFDGDRKTDITVWRPGDGYWYTISSKDGSVLPPQQWGSGALGDIPVAGDYDGDGVTDYAVWRPGDGFWYISKSSGGTGVVQWGSSALNDNLVPADYDGDGKTDIAVWRPGDGFWYIIGSKDGSIITRQWGAGYDPYNDKPVPGDYDGDGVTDYAVWRPGDGFWYISKSSGGTDAVQWGSNALNDVLVPADYDGDGKTDIAVWRPSEGMWYIISSRDGSIITQQWGAGYDPYNDKPVPGDYDGDGITDFAVWRLMDGYWHILKSSDGGVISQQWGWGLDPINDEPNSQKLNW